jgi:hypothetical protein
MSNVTRTAVHSWHINIGVGDCAIHLAVSEGGPKPRIMSAVWIDGGTRGGTGIAAIKKTINEIRDKYDTSGLDYDPNDMDTMRFDAIVVTHW